MTFPGEPIGGEAAIGWHLRQIDWHDNQASMADAMDCVESMNWHERKRLAHKTRLAHLEAQFPETACVARSDLAAEYNAAGE
jgi:hypothetical protein